MTLKNKLRALRSELDLTQKDVANYLDISTTQYSHKETGKNDFTLSECKKLAILFDRSMDEIFFTNKVNHRDTYILYPNKNNGSS